MGWIKLTDDQWDEVYTILVEECEASNDWFDRQAFIRAGNDITEWRFSGNLWMGGKFWNCNRRLYVNCYPEDETPDKLVTIERVNKKLEKFYSGSVIR